jgi:Holliday junction DNA helicase RuvA
MIGKLKGLMDGSRDGQVLIDVAGVGYEVVCNTRTLANLPAVGEKLSLYIETYVRENEIRLFGFTDEAEREWFSLLQSVQGVGAKVALAALGSLTPAELAAAVAAQDKAMIARTPGIGPKVASRIVTELRDKAPAGMSIAGAVASVSPAGGSAATDAVSALTNLGYPPTEANSAVAAAIKQAGDDAAAKELIRIGLKELAT